MASLKLHPLARRARIRRRLTLEQLERRDVPSFMAPPAYPAGSSPSAVIGSDFNGDGLPDIAVTNQTSPGLVSVLLNTGGAFGAPRSFRSGGVNPSSLAAADFTGDGQVDLVVTNQSSNSVVVLRGTGTGLFRRQIAYAAGPSPTSVTAGDFDGDGDFDVAVANAVNSGTVGVLLNAGNGIFLPPQFYAMGTRALTVNTGDFDSDGDLDLVAAGHIYYCNDGCYPTDPLVRVLLGNGNGTFQNGASFTQAQAPVDVGVGDLDGDGKLDLAIANDRNDGSGARVSVWKGDGLGSFFGFTSYPVGYNPHAIEVADLQADGDLDIVVPRYFPPFWSTEPRLDVLRNTGAGVFQVGLRYEAGGDPNGVAISDFTGDGLPDVAVANNLAGHGTVSLLAGVSTGILFQHPSYAAGTLPADVAAGDLNSDGDPDLVAGNAFGGSNVFVGASGGTFQSAGTVFTENYVSSVLLEDFTGDGHLDFAAGHASAAGNVVVVPGHGNGTLGIPQSHIGVDAWGAVAGDFNNDGIPDLAAASSVGKLSVLLGIGGGAFGAPVEYSFTHASRGIATADFNSDGNLDLVTAGKILLGNGDGTFQTAVEHGASGSGVAVGHFNADGFLDLATASWFYDRVDVLLGNGDGTFQPPAHFPSGNYCIAIAVADFNGDGVRDLATANSDAGTASVLLGNGDGTFQPAVHYFVHSNNAIDPFDIDVADFNGDSKPDLAVVVEGVPSHVAILLGNGDGTFQPRVNYVVGSDTYSAVIIDVNLDGKRDIAVANSFTNFGEPSLAILVNNGNGTFALSTYKPVGVDPQTLAAADFSGDGLPDIAVLNGGATPMLSMLINSTGDYDLPTTSDAGSYISALGAADFNNDGNLDVAATNFGTVGQGNQVAILLGNGDGSFQAAVMYTTANGPRAVQTADFDGDSKIDLVLAHRSGFVSFLRGNGDGSFQAAVNFPAGSFPWGLAIGDFDGDDKIDVAVTNDIGTGTVSILRGNGDGTFAPPVSYSVGANPQSLNAADINGDGIQDLVASNYDGGTISVLLGNGDGTFQLVVHFVAGAFVTALDIDDFNADGKPDLAVTHFNGVGILLNDGNWAPLPIGKPDRTGLSFADAGSAAHARSQSRESGLVDSTGGALFIKTKFPESRVAVLKRLRQHDSLELEL